VSQGLIGVNIALSLMFGMTGLPVFVHERLGPILFVEVGPSRVFGIPERQKSKGFGIDPTRRMLDEAHDLA
jgi:hypothetical protein